MQCPVDEKELVLDDQRRLLSSKRGPRGGKIYYLRQTYRCPDCDYAMVFEDHGKGLTLVREG